MKKILCLFLFLFLNLVFVSSVSYSTTIPYNISIDSNKTVNVDFDSAFELKIETTEDMVCKYSQTKDMDYEDMTGTFDGGSTGILHKKNLVDLSDGKYVYFVKCRPNFNTSLEPGELEVVLRVNSLITGQLSLSENSPLREGSYEVKLVLSKPVSQKPTLSYSVDEETYTPIILSGSQDVWKGYIVLGDDLGEGILSFKMKATDLEGREGTRIISDNSFLFDTIKPKIVSDLKAISKEGKIELEWHFNEDYDEFNIYRSTLKNPSYTDYYKTTDDKDYTDTGVEETETYYYRIAAVDDAGNEGDLSVIVSGTSLIDEDEDEGGLNPALKGKVESFLIEIESLQGEIYDINTNSLDSTEKDLFSKLKLEEKIQKYKNELVSLKNSVEKYKTQDLNEEELNQRIESSRVKLGVIEKSVPISLEVLQTEKRKETIGEEFILENINKLNPLLETNQIEKSVGKTLDLIKANNLEIESSFYETKINYLDGTTESFFVVERDLNSQFEKYPDTYFIESLTSSFVDSGILTINNIDYNYVDDTTLSFSSDNKNIFYYLKGNFNFQDLKKNEVGLISIYSVKEGGSSITGFAILNSSPNEYFWIVFGIIIFLGGVYFFYIRKGNLSDEYFVTLNGIEEGKHQLKLDDLLEAKKKYFTVKKNYSKLKKKEKNILYPQIEEFYNKILVFEIEENLDKLKRTKDKSLLKKVENLYEQLSLSHKKKLSDLFEKIKGEVENEK
jgi:hypothetical protein